MTAALTGWTVVLTMRAVLTMGGRRSNVGVAALGSVPTWHHVQTSRPREQETATCDPHTYQQSPRFLAHLYVWPRHSRNTFPNSPSSPMGLLFARLKLAAASDALARLTSLQDTDAGHRLNRAHESQPSPSILKVYH